MRYQFLELKETDVGEVAYVLDTETGAVTKTVVVDGTRGSKKQSLGFHKKVVELEDEIEAQEELPKPDIKFKKKPMLPPALAGVFIGQDQPGAAVETRRI